MNDFVLIDTAPPTPKEIRFVTYRACNHRNERDLFIQMFDVFEKLKEVTQQPNLNVDDVEFSIKEDIAEPWKVHYTCKLKDDVL